LVQVFVQGKNPQQKKESARNTFLNEIDPQISLFIKMLAG
jgi:hypothetical protein